MNLASVLRILLIAALAVSTAAAQSIISARSGAIHYVEGTALMDGETIEMEPSKFPQMEVGSTIETELGRAEILLTPGVILLDSRSQCNTNVPRCESRSVH